MANELRHEPTAAGTSCAQTDWEDVDIHRFQGQAVGDIAYASTNTQLRRLAVGANGTVLELAGGIPSWAAKGFSSRARAYRNLSAQVIPTGTGVIVALDVENYDGDGEFKSRTVVGQADATQANKLHDADGGFEAADVGAKIWNTTDNTYTTVSAFVDAGELTLTDDIMVNGENYELYHGRFTVTTAGYYFIVGSVYFSSPVADKPYTAILAKNGGSVSYTRFHSSCVSSVTAVACDVFYLNAADYIDLYAYHEAGGDETIHNASDYTYLAIHRLS